MVSISQTGTGVPKYPSIDIGKDDTAYILYVEDTNSGSGSTQDSFYLAEIEPPYSSVTSLNMRLFNGTSFTAVNGNIAAQDFTNDVWVVGGFWDSGGAVYAGTFNYYNGSTWSGNTTGAVYESSTAPDYRVYEPGIGTNSATGATDHKIMGMKRLTPFELMHHTWNGATFDTPTVTADGGSTTGDDQHFSIEKHKPYWEDESMYCWYNSGADELRCETVAMDKECIQPFSYFDVPLDVTPSRASTPGNQNDWISVDASSFVPVGATGVLLQVVADPATDYIYGVRRGDVTRCWMISSNSLCSLAPSRTTARAGTQRFLIAPLDTRRTFEIWTGSTTVTTYAIGYTGKSTRYFTPTSDLDPVDLTWSSGVWEDVDIASSTGTNTAIGAIVTVINTFASDQEFSLRKKGSTDDFYYKIDGRAANTFLVGVDGSEVFQARITSAIQLWLRGYVIDGAVFFTNVQDLSTGTTGSYVDTDITSHISSDNANGAILEIVNTDHAGHQTAIRRQGTTYELYKTMYHQGAFTGINGNDMFQQKIASTNQDVKLVGYTLNDCGTFECNPAYWWNCEWNRRRVVHPQNTGRGQLDDFPTLVCLNSGTIDYDYVQSGGQDLRFVDGDDKTLLAHEIEEWNPDGTSYVWVKIPQVDSNSSTDSILMYYDNPRTGDSQAPADVWDGDFKMVHHLNEASGNHIDSTSFGNDSIVVDVNAQGTATGQVNGADSFVAASTHNIDVAHSADLDVGAAESFTVEAWVNTSTTGNDQFVVNKKDGTTRMWQLLVDNNNKAALWAWDGSLQLQATGLTDVTDGSWHYLAGRWNEATGTAEIFLDGTSDGSITNGALSDLLSTYPVVIGEEGDTDRGFNFDGTIDEVRFSKAARTNDWINAQNSCMRCSFLSFDPEQTQATTSVELLSFDARTSNGGVELNWETASEVKNLGFNLFRAASPAGPFEKITANIIPGLGSSPAGAKYSYIDTGLTNGVTYFYNLEDIETTGKTEIHGPISATPQAGANQEGGDHRMNLRPNPASTSATRTRASFASLKTNQTKSSSSFLPKASMPILKATARCSSRSPASIR